MSTDESGIFVQLASGKARVFVGGNTSQIAKELLSRSAAWSGRLIT
jgi:hypothetical protein